ncbi:MAG TPA: Holliday junction branch migration protein RuvA [Thermomicrobiales bacterium]|nr:Holliday junction branch migration protein RuvA [Thermomicrobiales bacterium]
MIAGLIGTIHRAEQDAVLVNVNNVLYRVFTTGRVVSAAASLEGEQEFHTHLIVREDAQLLYGFLTPADLQWFQILISVNGVGPRLALAVLTRFSADELLSVISSEQIDLLTTVAGVGKRTASRIILDLRGKLPENLDTAVVNASATNADAIEALQALGYTMSEARNALGKLTLDEGATVEDQIVAALRELSST